MWRLEVHVHNLLIRQKNTKANLQAKQQYQHTPLHLFLLK